MNSLSKMSKRPKRDKRRHTNAETTTAGAVIVSVLSGFTELNTGQDINSALMVWFLFCISCGLLMQLSDVSEYRIRLGLSTLPAGGFVIVQVIGAYFYGITRFSSMDWDASPAAALRWVVLFSVTCLMIWLAVTAGPI